MVERKWARALLHLLRVVCLCVSSVYFLAFTVSIYGISVRSNLIGMAVLALDAHTPALLPTLRVSLTEGNCHLSFLVMFALALLLEWFIARKLYGTYKSHKSADLPKRRVTRRRGSVTTRG